MLRRTSIVDQLKIDTVIIASVIEIGDSSYIQSFSRALAVQREKSEYFGNEGSFQHPVFYEPIPFQSIDTNFTMQTDQLHPVIKVHSIDINGVSAASIVHIGSSTHISMESRIKHIRHLMSHHSPSER